MQTCQFDGSNKETLQITFKSKYLPIEYAKSLTFNHAEVVVWGNYYSWIFGTGIHFPRERVRGLTFKYSGANQSQLNIHVSTLENTAKTYSIGLISKAMSRIDGTFSVS